MLLLNFMVIDVIAKTGQLPAELGQLSSLVELCLPYNRLSGKYIHNMFMFYFNYCLFE